MKPTLQNSVELSRHIMSSHEAKAHACLDLQGLLFKSVIYTALHTAFPLFFAFRIFFIHSGQHENLVPLPSIRAQWKEDPHHASLHVDARLS